MNRHSTLGSKQQSRGTILSPLSILILIGIASRIFLLNWYQGTYTDGIIQLGLFENDNAYFPPLFPLLANWMSRVIQNEIIAGRLVSLLASTLTLIPLYHLAKWLYGSKAALWTGLFYLTAAVVNRWSLRVMSDSLFTLFFTTAVAAFVMSLRSSGEQNLPNNIPREKAQSLMLALSRVRKRRWLFLMIAASGLATLTRYQGLALLPLIAWSAWENRKGYSRWEIVETTLSLLPWVGLVWWLGYRGMEHGAQFAGRMRGWITLLVYWDMAETFLYYLPYALTLPVALLAIVGLVSIDRSPLARPLRCALLYLFILWLVVHAMFQSFQYRYFLPLIPVLLLYAGKGVVSLKELLQEQWKSLATAIAVAAVIAGGAFSFAVVYLQRNAFADIAEVGYRIAGKNFPGGRVFATGDYGGRPVNYKLSFYGGQPVRYFDLSAPDKTPMQAGDYLVLSNAYNSFEAVNRVLGARYELAVAYRSGRYTLFPLLPDIMVNPPGTTSQPLCMAYRYHQQVYQSVVLRVTGVRG